MQFYDKVKIMLESGKGGNGCVAARREAGIPYGGPAGGNGGNGGSIILRSDKNINTLIEYKFRKKYKAAAGENGMIKDKYGANAEDLILRVPVGTVLKDLETDRIVHYFAKDKEDFLVLKGGEGGLGNIEFKTSVLQYPNFALFGELGHVREYILELQLLADVALIGTPSVGKSTIINVLANTKAKVADYPFTTLVPHLGCVKVGDFSFNMIDVPGLIKGAAKGKGLGNDFLRHIVKSKIFCIVSDISRFNIGIDEVMDIFDELFDYIKQKLFYKFKTIKFGIEIRNGDIILVVTTGKELLMEKEIIFVVNKQDLVQDEEIIGEYRLELMNKILEHKHLKKITKKVLDKNIFVISAATHYGVENYIDFLALNLQKPDIINLIHNNIDLKGEPLHEEEDKYLLKNTTEVEKPLLIEKGFLDEVDGEVSNVWEISNAEISKLVFTLPWGNEEAEMRFRKTLSEKGYIHIFEKEGFQKGDVFKIKSFYEGNEDRYIVW